MDEVAKIRGKYKITRGTAKQHYWKQILICVPLVIHEIYYIFRLFAYDTPIPIGKILILYVVYLFFASLIINSLERRSVKKDTAFIRHMNGIVRKFCELRDPQQFYQDLMSMEESASHSLPIVCWHINVAVALAKQEHFDESLAVLTDLDVPKNYKEYVNNRIEGIQAARQSGDLSDQNLPATRLPGRNSEYE